MSASEENDHNAVRRLVAADAAAYRALMLDAYATHPSAFTSTVEERSGLPLRWWEERLGSNAGETSVVYGAFDDAGRLACSRARRV